VRFSPRPPGKKPDRKRRKRQAGQEIDDKVIPQFGERVGRDIVLRRLRRVVNQYRAASNDALAKIAHTMSKSCRKFMGPMRIAINIAVQAHRMIIDRRANDITKLDKSSRLVTCDRALGLLSAML
jgi:hypothetical protein